MLLCDETNFAVLVEPISHNLIVLDDRKRFYEQRMELSAIKEKENCHAKKGIINYLYHTSEQRATLFVTP